MKERVNEKWDAHYQEVTDYVRQYRRRPSKHRPDEVHMHYWIKFNKKRMAMGKMPPERQKRFTQLLAKMEKYRRVNQYYYLTYGRKAHARQLDLFADQQT